MLKQEFESRYIEESEISLEFYHDENVTLPCSCDDANCEGWAAVSKNELSIKSHNYLYNHESDIYRGRNVKNV